MDYLMLFKAIIIAIVEGITEFIPVSSTGHMIIVGDIIDFKGEFANLFTVVIQLGAILAIVVLYYKKIFSSIAGVFKGRRKDLRFWVNIVVACIPAVILGFLFDDLIDDYLFNIVTVTFALIIGAVLMLISEKRVKINKTVELDDISISQAFKVGMFQCLALWPGMSRSASTIIGGWISGLSTVAATEFSFFLAIPIMVGASGLKLVKYGSAFSKGEVIILVIGFIVAFLSALVCVERFVEYLKKKPMKNFAYYRLILAAVLFVLAVVGIINV